MVIASVRGLQYRNNWEQSALKGVLRNQRHVGALCEWPIHSDSDPAGWEPSLSLCCGQEQPVPQREPALECEQPDPRACPLDLIKLIGQPREIGVGVLIVQMRSWGSESLITVQQLVTRARGSRNLVSNPHSKAFPCFSCHRVPYSVTSALDSGPSSLQRELRAGQETGT